MAVTAEDAKLAERFIYEELDLRRVRDQAKMTYRWDDAKVARAEAAYRDFLWVCWNFAKAEPFTTWISQLSDDFGHIHLQDPSAFVADCEQMFGPGKTLVHLALHEGKRVHEPDCDRARAQYALLGLEAPHDLRQICIWAIVSN